MACRHAGYDPPTKLNSQLPYTPRPLAYAGNNRQLTFLQNSLRVGEEALQKTVPGRQG